MRWYRLEGHEAVECGQDEGIATIVSEKCRVGIDRVGDRYISTIFLGRDVSVTGDPPELFETIVLAVGGQPVGEYHYATWAEAEAGHQREMEKARRRHKAAPRPPRERIPRGGRGEMKKLSLLFDPEKDGAIFSHEHLTVDEMALFVGSGSHAVVRTLFEEEGAESARAWIDQIWAASLNFLADCERDTMHGTQIESLGP